ncbi:synergin gamma-like isoform X2 [Thrips palmi]|uniref:Synergin gamma-like isoform X2 n=1 Tax=Thrips palmi TaxID=161013 RepID=A0A6P8YRR1_THRPL|nr:synergin gamma-like isoform X2 [Thrips palmi]
MFPQQGSGMGRPTHMMPSLPTNSIQAVGIPGMPQSAVMATSGPSTGFVMPHNFPVNVPVNVQPNQNKIWPLNQQQTYKPQDTQNQQQSQNQTDHKHRDYLKQQQRLKAMPLSSSKGMSADALIGNLLEKKDTFTPKQPAPMPFKQQGQETPGQIRQPVQPGPNMNRSAVSANPNDNFPGWLSPNSSRLPPIYSHIWSLVCDPASGGSLVDTNKILALLLTSSLPKEVLGFIWNLATNGANVQLNQQQLYVTLALVALAQMGCTFNNLSVLNFVPTPPIPTFNMNVQKSSPDDKQKRPESTLKPSTPFIATPTVSPPPSNVSGPLPTTTLPTYIPSKTQLDDDFADDFTDFQSADTSHAPSSNVCNTLPATAVIQPSATAKQVVNELNHSVVSKLGRSHGRSIGSRLANHTLGAPKSNMGLKPHRAINSDNVYVQDEVGFSFEKNQSAHDAREQAKYYEGEENEDFSDFQTAASLNVNVDELFPKCHPKPKAHDFMLKESAIRNESDDEEFGKQKEEELLSLDSPTFSKTSAAEIQNLPTQVDIPLVAPPMAKASKELMSVEEDKYSALRILENIPSSVTKPLSEVNNIPDTDDFGDFVSADDMFSEIAVRDTGNSVKQTNFPTCNDVETTAVQNIEFAVDDWASSVFQSAGLTQEPSSFESQPSNEMKSKYGDLSLVFSDLDISQKDNNDLLSTVDPPSKWGFDFDTVKESPQLNLSSNFIDTTAQNDDDFGDFVGPDSTQVDDTNNKTSPVFLSDQLWVDSGSSKQVPSALSDNRSVSSLELPGVTLSRHGSLPSLDLNLFPTSDDMSDKASNSQLADWIRCLERSCFLLQSAASTFTNITAHSVLLEVLNTAEGKNYLSNLLEVHRVTWRIQRSYQRSGHESNQIDAILGSVVKVWSTLQTFYKLANIETAVENDGSDEESGQPGCGVCGSPASRGVLEYGGHVYHAPCANLWLNCVDRTLPAHSPLL